MQHNPRTVCKPPWAPPHRHHLLPHIHYPTHTQTVDETSVFGHEDILQLGGKKGKAAGCVVVANLVGAWEKKHVGIAYTSGPAPMCQSQTKYRIRAAVAEQALPVFGTSDRCAFTGDATKTHGRLASHGTVCVCVSTVWCCWTVFVRCCSGEQRRRINLANLNRSE